MNILELSFLVEMMGFDSRANCALGLPRSQTSTGSLLYTDSPSNPLLFITNSLPYSLFGGDDGIRTHDPLLAGQVLSQLSYTPIFVMGFCFSPLFSNSFKLLVGPSGLEPPLKLISRFAREKPLSLLKGSLFT